MTTLVGIKSSFTDAVKELLELEYNAVEAYEAAVDRINNNECKIHLTSFLTDHKRHVNELFRLLKQHNEEPPQEANTKQWITKGKVVVSNITCAEFILAAMKNNEIDTNDAYERIYARGDQWQDFYEIIRRGLEDEKRHKKWLNERPLGSLLLEKSSCY